MRDRRHVKWLQTALPILLIGNFAAHAGDAGRQHYLQLCIGCHQGKGEGLPQRGIPPLSGNVGYFVRSAEGRAFLIQVPGVAQAALDDPGIAELLNWVLITFGPPQLPEDFRPYTADEVARYRAIRPADIAAARSAVVTALRTLGMPVK
jgi:mono/diheme cytochrome c family protein